MPCTDGGVPYPPTREEELDAKAVAMLCGITRAIVEQRMTTRVLGSVNWRQAGVTRAEFEEWWGLHQKHDREKLIEEVKNSERERNRKAALAKLTAAERKALDL